MAEHDEQFDLPKSLADDLARIYEPASLNVTGRMDDAILNRARARLLRGRRPLRWWGGAAAAAACLLLASAVWVRVHSSSVEPAANGRVTIVDALKLAHQIQTGHGRDVNGDGVIDQRDVDTLAMAAVQLDPGGMQ